MRCKFWVSISGSLVKTIDCRPSHKDTEFAKVRVELPEARPTPIERKPARATKLQDGVEGSLA